MLNLKVGVMPGRLEEVVVEGGETAKEIFGLVNVDAEGYEIRLDGEVIDANSCVRSGNLLVAMKRIKGNMPTIKVGVMPGRLSTIEFEGQERASDLFQRADVTLSNHEIRLDGTLISEDTYINSGNLLVAMAKIKGNSEAIAEVEYDYVSDYSEEEIKVLLNIDVDIPTTIESDFVEIMDDRQTLIGNGYSLPYTVVDTGLFYSIYEKQVREDLFEERQFVKLQDDYIIEPALDCACTKAENVINELLTEAHSKRDVWVKYANEENLKIELLETLLERLK